MQCGCGWLGVLDEMWMCSFGGTRSCVYDPLYVINAVWMWSVGGTRSDVDVVSWAY